MKALIARFVRQDEGQDLIEYALLGALISVTAIAAMGVLSAAINGEFAAVSGAL
jgi:Flp pilus assembly pilin Flp